MQVLLLNSPTTVIKFIFLPEADNSLTNEDIFTLKTNQFQNAKSLSSDRIEWFHSLISCWSTRAILTAELHFVSMNIIFFTTRSGCLSTHAPESKSSLENTLNILEQLWNIQPIYLSILLGFRMLWKLQTLPFVTTFRVSHILNSTCIQITTQNLGIFISTSIQITTQNLDIR